MLHMGWEFVSTISALILLILKVNFQNVMHTMRPILIRDVCSFITETRNLNILVINYALKLFFSSCFYRKKKCSGSGVIKFRELMSSGRWPDSRSRNLKGLTNFSRLSRTSIVSFFIDNICSCL